MKTIGLIGGMSWESTVTYYQMINEGVKQALGGLHSAPCVLWSVDFAEIEQYQQQGDWERAGTLLADAARNLERAGADCVLICTNTMHKVAEQIEAATALPLLHIADATAEALEADQVRTVALLGTRYTMEQDFYKRRLEDRGVQVLVPEEEARQKINAIIFDELCLGTFSGASKAYFLDVMKGLRAQGAQGVILGCTEIGLLIQQADTEVPLYDTTQIHARSAISFALDD